MHVVLRPTNDLKSVSVFHCDFLDLLDKSMLTQNRVAIGILPTSLHHAGTPEHHEQIGFDTQPALVASVRYGDARSRPERGAYLDL
jgi:hypothetical protein